MLTLTRPTARIVLDATAVDTGHRTRGIGRYAGALWAAMSRLDDTVVALRLTHAERSWNASLPDRHFLRFMKSQRALGPDLRRAGCVVFGATEPWTLPRATPGLRVVPTCHDVIPLEFASSYTGWDNAKWNVYFQWLRSTRTLDDCPSVIVPSVATRDAIAHYLSVDPGRVVVIPHGVDHERFRLRGEEELHAVRGTLGIGAEPFLLYVGGYDYRKNVPCLVEGFAASGVANDVLLVLAGQASREERAAALDAAQRCGVMHRVVWAGRVRDELLPALYGSARAFVYPSLSEGFGLQVLEAMACGCPVVTSNRGALREVAGEAALLVDPERPSSIGAALRRVLDHEEHARMRGQGLEHARRFNWDRTARATLEVYRRALD